jgi:hypothetical protein
MAESQAFSAVVQEANYRRDVQKYKFNYTYHINAIVNPASVLPVLLTIEQDADFWIVQMTGSVYGPCNANGVPTSGPTDFIMPGWPGAAGRGLTVKINDTGAGRDLTSGFVPVELLLTPGYDLQFHLPYQVKYFAKRNSKIRFEFTNRDAQANARQQVDIAINGYKYALPEGATVDEAANA